MFALPTPPLWPGFSAVFFSAVLGASSSEASQTPLGLTIRLANSQLQEREPHARAPGGPSSRPGRTRPGSLPAPGLAPGRENWQAGAALPGGGVGNRGGYDAPAAATPCPDQVRQRGRGAQQGWGASPLGETLGWLPGPRSAARPPHTLWTQAWGFPGLRAQPPAWENPGPLPGATALPGRAGEGIPGICPETAGASLGTTSPDMGSASVA